MIVLTYPREADMTTPVARRADVFGCEGWHSFFEFHAPQGMPDIVFALFSDEAVAARSASPLASTFIERREAAVLLALDERRPLAIDDLAALSGFATSTVAATLRALGERQAVERAATGWCRSGSCPSRLRSAVAIELKLRDWRRALDQAARYRAFADRTFVVLDERHGAAAAKHSFVFRFNHVGLATLSPWRTIEVFASSRRRRPYDPIGRFVAGERLWLRHQEEMTGARSLGMRAA